MDDSVAAYTHALHWSLSGSQAHAKKTIEILNDYAQTLKSVEGHDARLLVGITGIHFVNAAELIAHSDTCLLYTSPSPRDKRQSRMPSSA